MRLLSVNVGGISQLDHNGRAVESGIVKTPVDGPVEVNRLGLEGDKQADKSVHGGQDKAVYVYSADDYPYWEEKLGDRKLPFGQFGENFTISEIDDKTVSIGDYFKIGPAIFQVTQPRVPCFKLGIHMNDPMFPSRFMASGRYGFYLRVVEEGSVRAGDPVELFEKASGSVSVWEIMQIMHHKQEASRDEIVKMMNLSGLSTDWRSEFEKKLTSLPL